MSEIGSVQPADRPAPVVAPVAAAAPARAVAAEPTRTPLEPAVKLDLSADAPSPAPNETDYRAQVVRDSDTREMVYQVLDPLSGDIVVQLPSVVVLKARAYAETEAARAAEAERGQSGAGVDRSA